MSLQATIDFLAALAANNNKAWFDAHRNEYQQARAAFEEVVDDLIHRMAAVDDPGPLTAKDTMFRINRDVRFSKDKSPYKTNLSAVIARGGRKATGRVYYLQVAPDDSFAAGGLHDPSREQLDAVRRAIVADAAPLRAILSRPDFIHHFGGMTGDQLKTAPQGYDREHPDIDLLRYKQFLAIHPFSPSEVVADDFVQRVLVVFEAMKPFNVYLEAAASGRTQDLA